MGEAAQTRTPDTQLFRDVFNASPIGIAVENLEGQPIFVNPAFCSFLGFSEEELRNKHCVDFSPPEDAEKDWALFQQLRAGSIDHYQLEKRYFRRDGSLVWGSLSISLLKSSPSPLVLAMVEDITDKKKAEEARYKHAAVIESSEDAIASGTLDGIIVSWNTGAQKIYGYTEAEAVGKPISMLVPPELPDEENKILETLKSGDRIEHFETVRVTKTGKRINVSLTISPIKDSTGRTVGISGIARDITERKLAEEALRASEERLRLAQQAARIGTFDWNIRTGVNTWTPELEAMYGLPPGGFGGTQTAFENLVHPDDRAGVIKLVDAAMKSGQPTEGEWRVVWADGSVHWIAGRWQVFMDASGESSKMIGVIIDVTERKRTEEALEKSEEKFSKAFRQSPMVLTLTSIKDNRYIDVNETFERITGWRRDEIIGRTPFDIGFWVDPAERVELTKRLLTEGRLRDVETRFRMKDGSIRIGSATAEVFELNGEPCMLGVGADITERKQAERRLRESEEQFRTLAEAIPQLCWMAHGDGHIFWYNQRWYTYTGTTQEEMEGWGWHSVHDPQALPLVLERWKTSIATGEPFDMVFPIKAANGIFHPFLTRVTPVKDSKGSVVRWFGTNTDVTELRNAQEALSEMSRKLVQAQEQERARIARELHDDINQRLAMLGIELERLQDNPSEVRSRVQELRKQTTELSNDVQALSHDLHSSQLEYLGAVAGMKSWCKEFGERQGMEIDCRHDVRSTLPAEIGLCLFRVLQEALHNAAKHSGVKRIEVQLREDSREIHLIVRDSGMGFDVEAVKQGKGLGLTSMRERIRLVNGTIDIQSKPMGGTTIHARVPFTSERGPQPLAV